jgi:thioredoxin 1
MKPLYSLLSNHYYCQHIYVKILLNILLFFTASITIIYQIIINITNITIMNVIMSNTFILSSSLLSISRCAPCKTAAPLYSQLANDPKLIKKNISFRKCNIDQASPVAMLCKVTQMPTFKVYKNGAEVDTILGWNEEALREAIQKATGR